MDLSVSGLASGFDWKTLVSQLADVERSPQKQLLANQNVLRQRDNAYTSINTQMTVLNTSIQALKDKTLYSARLTQTSAATVASATAGTGTALGSYSFNITQLATASTQQGTSGMGAPLSATNVVSGVVLSSANFSSAVTGGTFTVNGKQVTIATTDSLQAVFDKISAATGNVTASYDSATDEITLSSASSIVLGSATDTSNFLQAAKLHNNGTGTITSSTELGGIKTGTAMATANFSTAISDGGSGAGEFKINGVSIAYSATADSVANVITRINNSSAGVTASYDSINDRFILTSKASGDMGIALEDVTGNFLAATGISGGTLQRGNDLLYSVNGGATLSSQSNTITETTSGITGLSVTALNLGSTTITVSSDTTKIKTAINDFISAYNKVQAVIDTNTASTTDSTGKVTAGILAGESDPHEIASTLRKLSFGQVSGLTGALKSLADLGISTNGNDNNLSLTDETKLDAALANNLTGVQDLFANDTVGLSVSLNSYMDKTIGDSGTLPTKQSNLTKQASDIDTQIADLERIVQADSQRMTDQFIAMEAAQAQLNQQLQYLQKSFGSTTTTTK